ncbi:SusC/RagA family TonB-linked outer membrane protein [Catalinimonas sp. 4WD22]|uniref:SusC/RagA family TonB-linked outer membrane protein n=1 Tax=Catalinimonas locisalis TaxID=3133978 RepID=UPI0031017FD0
MKNLAKWTKVLFTHFLYPKIYSSMLLSVCIMLSMHAAMGQMLQASIQPDQAEKKISLQVDNKSIAQVLEDLQSLTGYVFVFSNDQIDVQAQVSFIALEEPLSAVLKKIFNGKDIHYRIYADQVILFRDNLPKQIRQTKPGFNQTGSNTFQGNINSLKGNTAIIPEKVLQQVIRGTVTDGESGDPLPGVNVLAKGTTTGTVTSIDGNYRLTVEDDVTTLVFSSIGFVSEEVEINGREIINVDMMPDIASLQEVVVTAFGIEREKKALSYAVQEVDGEAIAKVGNPNMISSLQGKVAGVIVRPSTGAPGARPQVTIRGSRSFVGDNEPLYVVDGLPIDGGDRAVDINPSDIASINVLKGPTAAALYGLRASNGVIVITTKRGKGAGGKPQISFDSNYSFDRISVMPDIQQTYMQGENGMFNAFSSFSWGPRIDTMGNYINQLGEEEAAAAYNTPEEFFKTGGTYNGNFNIANSFEGGNYAVGVGFTDQQGIVPGTEMQRLNFKLAGDYKLGERLTVGTSLNYSNLRIDEAVQGGGNSSLFYAAFFAPISYNLAAKPISEPGNPYSQINFRGQHDNIYWSLQNNYTDNKTNRFFGNINTNYKIAEGLSLNYRLGLDTYTESNKTVLALGSGDTGGRTDPPSGGRIYDRLNTSQQINSNLNLQYSKTFAESFQLDILLGNEIYDVRSRAINNQGNDIIIGGFDHVSNTSTQTTDEYIGRRRVVGFYGNVAASWNNTFFLNATGRNDIVSNMPRGNRSFFYPSLGLGLAFTELITHNENYLTFGKVRASIAEVGQAGPIYSTQNVYVQGGAGGFLFPFNGINAFTLSNNLNSQVLEPENTRTVELGLDLRFFNARLGIDYTYFDTRSDGQIYRVPIARSTGFATELRNAGEMSIKGHELILTGQPVYGDAFQWEVTTNFTSYNNTVVSLAEGIERLELGGFRPNIVAEEGREYPFLSALGYARDPATGQVVVDGRELLPNGNPNPRYGMPLRSTEEVPLGSVQPDFEIGFVNTFTYKGFSLMAQLDWRKGGVISSGVNRLGKLYGVLAVTENREEDYVFPGKQGFYDEAGNLVVEGDNNIVIQRGFEFFRRNEDPIVESNVYDASFVKLREVSLTYDLPQSLLGGTFISSASVFLTGRNFLLWANLPNFDPETGVGNGGGNSQGEEYGSYPQLKSYGAGVRLKF